VTHRQVWAATLTAVALACAPPALVAQQASTVKPRVHVIATGGTNSNMGNDPRRTGAELVAGIPGMAEVAEVTTEQFSNVASGAVTQPMLRDLARRIRTVLSESNPPAGVIVTHGTDTMEETAFFLDLTIGGCAPVILTGAMRQANWVGADGPANLLNSAKVAVSPDARGRGTLLLMNDEIFLAREVTKSNTTRVNAFSAPEAGSAGVADPDGIYFRGKAPSTCSPPLVDLDRVESFPRVDIVYSYIDADSTVIDALVAAGARGLVMAGVGRGGTTPSQSRALRRATEQGVIVLTSNRTGGGRVGRPVNPDGLRSLPEGRGATMGAGDLNPQKARILLSLALAAGMKPDAIASLIGSVQ
jgi:L-asparaginase